MFIVTHIRQIQIKHCSMLNHNIPLAKPNQTKPKQPVSQPAIVQSVEWFDVEIFLAIFVLKTISFNVTFLASKLFRLQPSSITQLRLSLCTKAQKPIFFFIFYKIRKLKRQRINIVNVIYVLYFIILLVNCRLAAHIKLYFSRFEMNKRTNQPNGYISIYINK